MACAVCTMLGCKEMALWRATSYWYAVKTGFPFKSVRPLDFVFFGELLILQAGIEHCTRVKGGMAGGTEDIRSYLAMLQYVDERVDPKAGPGRSTWTNELVMDVGNLLTLESVLAKATDYLPRDIDHRRAELEVYLHAVRVIGTVLGGVSS